MRRSPGLVLVTCAAVLLMSISACGFPDQDDATPLPNEELPIGLRDEQTPSTTAAVATEHATIWFVADGALVPVRQEVAAPASAESLIDALLAGPTEAEQERGLRSALPDPTVIVQAESMRGLARVELSPAFADIAAADQLLAVGQVVMTMTGLPGVGGVAFTFDDEPVAVPIPTGESSTDAIVRDQFSELVRT